MMVTEHDNDEERSARIDHLVKELQKKRKDIGRGQSVSSHGTEPAASPDQELRPVTTQEVTPFVRRAEEDHGSDDSTKPKIR